MVEMLTLYSYSRSTESELLGCRAKDYVFPSPSWHSCVCWRVECEGTDLGSSEGTVLFICVTYLFFFLPLHTYFPAFSHCYVLKKKLICIDNISNILWALINRRCQGRWNNVKRMRSRCLFLPKAHLARPSRTASFFELKVTASCQLALSTQLSLTQSSSSHLFFSGGNDFTTLLIIAPGSNAVLSSWFNSNLLTICK